MPPYVLIRNLTDPRPDVLREPAQKVSFPLSQEDQSAIDQLREAFIQESNACGLAAPQIGLSKCIIIVEAENPEWKKFRPDFTQTMPRTLLLNPSYAPLTEIMTHDFEACLSVEGWAGEVPRYSKIQFSAQDASGTPLSGIAEGFLARILQHEIDHLNGILFIDRALPESLVSIEEYRERRRRALNQEKPIKPRSE